MTEPRLQQLLAEWTRRLGLERWEIDLRVEPCECETAYMEVERSFLYERATIAVAPWLMGQGDWPADCMRRASPHHVEETLVHELLHLHTRDIMRAGREADGQMHRDAYTIYEQRLEDAEEQLVDRLAVALVRAHHDVDGTTVHFAAATDELDPDRLADLVGRGVAGSQ